jgi:ADP-heptose:LPS heptosyltransferase
MRTLVVRLDHLGDVLLTTPLIRALALGGHSVDVLVRRPFEAVFENSPYVENSFVIESVAPRFPESWWQLSRWMRWRRYEGIILAFANEKRLCFASAFSGAKRRIAMWSGIWGRLTFHECLRSKILEQPRPFSKILLQCAEAFGVPEKGLIPDIFLSDQERKEARELIPAPLRGRRLIGIHPGSAGNTCNLPTEVYAELAAILLDKTDCALAITGTSAEQSLVTSWPRHVLLSERVWVSLGQLSLRQLAAVISQMAIFVCPSTGPLHLASAAQVSTVSPFCPVSPLNAAIWGNLGGSGRVIEPAACPRMTGAKVRCNFQGQITAVELSSQVFDALNATNSNGSPVAHSQ